jgi:magnesium-protoporphyrin O-methyltransferase
MMATVAPAYVEVRDGLATYFDRTAKAQWIALTSDAPVSLIRQTVRAGRDRMRETLLSWLPDDLRGARILDAGCGTGALAHELGRRGADVLGIDLAPGLVAIARERLPAGLPGRVTFEAGDMLAAANGGFDNVVAMDSLIHYPAPEIVRALEALGARARGSILFTFAPRTALLAAMHAAGKLFPRGDRSPAIVPVAHARLEAMLRRIEDRLPARSARVASGFYTSHALEWARAG